jgi:hypothetical protein
MDDRGWTTQEVAELCKALDHANRRMFAELAAWQVAMTAWRRSYERCQ